MSISSDSSSCDLCSETPKPSLEERKQRLNNGLQKEIELNELCKNRHINPKRFEVKAITNSGNYVALKVHYPDAKNYKGIKVLE